MASDSQVLAAIGLKTGGECRYFEIVHITCGDLRKKCFVCVGKHSLFFLRQDLNGPIHEGAEVFFSHIIKVVQDENSDQHILLSLTDLLAGWGSDRLFLKAENRGALLRHLRCSWQTDHMWRLGRVVVFPFIIQSITKDRNMDHFPMPYIGHRWAKFQGYRFMVPESFADQPNSIQDEQTGEYVNSQGVSLVVHVHEAFSLEQLVQIRRDNIRWVAADYKVQLTSEEKQFYVIKNCGRIKRMNLGADIAQWHQWELVIRTKSATIVCLLLRRQYIPPVCHSAQDIAVLMRCPEEVWKVSEVKLLLGAYQVADTLCSDAANVSIYRDIVQAKLDALRFDEEGLEWVASHLKLKTCWEKEAKRFVRTLCKVMVDSRVDGFTDELLDLPAMEVLVDAEPQDEWAELEFITDFSEFIQEMRTSGEGLPLTGVQAEALDEDSKLKVQNAWLSRVARYFAWAVDGGLLGSRFNLDLLIEGLAACSEEDHRKGMSALNFLTHLRPRDMTRPYREVSLTQQMKEKNLSQWMFNDRVMLAILSTDFLKKQIGKGRTADYFKCLSNLLGANCATNLKAYVCRLFMEIKAGGQPEQTRAGQDDSSSFILLVPSLLSLLKSGGIFLATYASAALVNLSSGNQAVKSALMGHHDFAPFATASIRTKDDDLGYYTLMLMVNLTKDPHSRNVIASSGLIPLLYDILTSSYHQVRPAGGKGNGELANAALSSLAKERLLTQVAIVIGQFSNDDAFREQFIDMYPHTVKCMLYMFTTAQIGGMLSNKVMFALKQLCASRNDQKNYIGNHVIIPLIESLGDQSVEKNTDFIHQSLLLLIMLSGLSTNSELMYKKGLIQVLQELSNHRAAKKTDGFGEKVTRLMYTMSELAAVAAAGDGG